MPRKKGKGHAAKGAAGRQHPEAFPGKKCVQRGNTAARPSFALPHNTPYTLQDEVRNTGRAQNFWDLDLKLRHTKINFVSAGKFDSSKLVDLEAQGLNSTLGSDCTFIEDGSIPVANRPVQSPSKDYYEKSIERGQERDAIFQGTEEEEAGSQHENEQEEVILENHIESSREGPSSLFYVDVKGSEPNIPKLPAPKLKSRSSSSSSSIDSDEEIIVFAGRGTANGRDTMNPRVHNAKSDAISKKAMVIEDKTSVIENRLVEDMSTVSLRESPNQSSAPATATLPQHDVLDATKEGSSHGRLNASEDAILADYIQNLDSNDLRHLTQSSFSKRELGGTDSEEWQDSKTNSPKTRPSAMEARNDGWDIDDLEDFDDLSTSDGVRGEVTVILSKRTRKSGIQYLTIWNDDPVDEARWITQRTLSLIPAADAMAAFEAEERMIAEMFDADEESEKSEDDDDDDDMISDDVDDLLADDGMTSNMSDRRIALLLAKQEELGLGSGELLLYDGAVSDDEQDISFSHATTSNGGRHTKARGNGRLQQNSKRAEGIFPAAGHLADAYDGFDILDFERPSLKKKPKGRKGKLAFDISDSELVASMEMAWEVDRSKKKQKKLEREELRSQGLLGGRHGKPDLDAKYKEGMNMNSVKEEIKAFLRKGDTTLELPPMDKADRKTVHELANAFNLKSKSVGKGNKRSPVLYRTSRTLAYSDRAFESVETRISRRFLPRMDLRGKNKAAGSSSRGGSGFGAASYRDGDVVGASAPELGVENKGRAMLEKMGWSTGTALGALNNKGILLPVSHIVKTTKAGLG